MFLFAVLFIHSSLRTFRAKDNLMTSQFRDITVFNLLSHNSQVYKSYSKRQPQSRGIPSLPLMHDALSIKHISMHISRISDCTSGGSLKIQLKL